jgi:protoheme ferro-lyase
LVLIRTMSSKSRIASPPSALRARIAMSHGTPSTQCEADDHVTASAIQYHRLLKERMSMSSKTVSYQSKAAPLLQCRRPS